MALSIQRRWADIAAVDGVSNNDDNLEISFLIYGDNGEAESDVLAFVQDAANIPHVYLGLLKENVSFDRLEDTENHWVAVASYVSGSSFATIAKLSTDEVRWTVVGGSGVTVRRTLSAELVSENLGTGQNAPTLSGTAAEKAMGIVYRDGDFEIEGVDASVGGTQISVQTVWSFANAITNGRIVQASELADQKVVNSTDWNGFAAGTLMLDTFSAVSRGGTEPDFDIDMSFIFSKNLTSIVVGNGITVASKKGHETLDILYAKKEVAGLPIPVPIRAAVHRTQAEVDFSTSLWV